MEQVSTTTIIVGLLIFIAGWSLVVYNQLAIKKNRMEEARGALGKANDPEQARRHYNNAVRDYNDALERFPAKYVGKLYGLKKVDS